uniref:Uncharacterized protein n=1 Tax=viral metagenome TaxID=1070528 RepID=A0A6C0JK10_9ZZZZ
MVKCFCYWDSGYEKMPEMIKYIYNHNKEISEKYKFELILVTDENVKNYIYLPPGFMQFEANHKSDIVRIYCLHKFGGFWIDMDVILIKDLNLLWSALISSGKYAILDIELNSKIGCATMAMLANTVTSTFCYNYINVLLESYPMEQKIKWDFLGPANVKLLYLTMPENIILNNYEKVKRGCNFITWADKPGFSKEKWLLKTPESAKEFADKLDANVDCYYVITWTIYKKNDMSNNLIDQVFNNKRSVFYYLTMNETKRKEYESSLRYASIQDIINNKPLLLTQIIDNYLNQKPAEKPIIDKIPEKSKVVQGYAYHVSVAAVFKNETHALDEWIRHYLSIGIDHIYLINDFSTDAYKPIIAKYGNKITLFENNVITSEFGRQSLIYEKYLRPILGETEYMAIVDLDEFLYSPARLSFKDFFSKHDKYAQYTINWLIFGSNGYIDQPESLIDSFTMRAKTVNNDVINPYDFKSIVKTSKLIKFSVHSHECLGDTLFLGSESEEMVINHYIIQSLVFYMEVKCVRGCADNFQNCLNKQAVEEQRKNRKRFNFIDKLANEEVDDRLKLQK